MLMFRKLLQTAVICFYFFNTAYSQLHSIQIVTVPGNNNRICEGSSVRLNIYRTITGGYNLIYKWDNSPFLSNTSIYDPVANPTTTAKFSVTVTDPVYNITLKDSIWIFVVSKPVIHAGADDSLCFDTPFQLQPKEVKNCKSFEWSHNGRGNLSGKFIQNPVYYPAPGESGRVDFVFTGYPSETLCGSVSDNVSVHYFERPQVKINTPDGSICFDDKFPVSASVGSGTLFQWKHTGKGTLEKTNTLNPVYVPHKSDFENIKIMLEGKGVSCNVTDTLSLSISSINLLFPGDETLCESPYNYPLVITQVPGLTYLWSTGATTHRIDYIPKKDSTFTVQVKNRNGCILRDTIKLKVNKRPGISKIEFDQEGQFIDVLPSGFSSYIFTVNNQIVQEGKSNRFYFGNYAELADTVKIQVINELGCLSFWDGSSVRKDIFLIPQMIWVNAFSPNGDGINDRLLAGRRILVIDRTSKILYEGWNGWDGTFNGNEMPVGTYFYILYHNKGEVFYKGPVTLIR